MMYRDVEYRIYMSWITLGIVIGILSSRQGEEYLDDPSLVIGKD